MKGTQPSAIYATGFPGEVEAVLQEQNIRTKRDNPFTRYATRDILKNPVYMVADKAATRDEKDISPHYGMGRCGRAAQRLHQRCRLDTSTGYASKQKQEIHLHAKEGHYKRCLFARRSFGMR